MSSGDSGSTSKKRKPRPSEPRDANTSESEGSLATWFPLGMAVVGLLCLIFGIVGHKFEWKPVLAATVSLLMGISFAAIGLLELEWLERVVGIFDGIGGLITQWFWTSSFGTLSESDALGRRGATVIWMIFGIPIYLYGCLLALRVTVI